MAEAAATLRPLYSHLLLTRRRLEKFRRAELVDRAPRHCRRQISHGLVADALVEALDDRRIPTRRPLQFGQPDEHAEPDEQREDERGARDKAFHETPRNRPRVGGVHSCSCERDAFAAGTSYGTRPRRTSSIATRSAFFGICCSLAPSNRTRAPRRSCLARSAATSTNRNRL